MATSGEYTLDLTTADIIDESFEILQASGQGETQGGNLYNQALNSLNMMLKLWEAQGIHLWTYTEYTMFLVNSQAVYDQTDADVRVVNSLEFDSTELGAAAAVAATTITLDSVANAAIGKAIGILDDDQEIHWTVIEQISGSDVDLKDAITVASADNNIVRLYPTSDLGTTTLAAGAAILDTTIQVASLVGIEAGMNIGITGDTANTVLWTTVNSIDADTDIVTIDDAIADTSTLGNDVIFYTSEQNFKPFSRVLNDMVRRHAGEGSDYEIPIVFQSRKDYMDLPNKNQAGTVIQAYYSRQEPTGIWYLWNTPSSSVEYINFTAERQIQIMVDTTDTFDLPAEWYDAITYNLAKRLILKVGCSAQRTALIREDAKTYLDEALAFDTAVYPIRLKPMKYG